MKLRILALALLLVGLLAACNSDVSPAVSAPPVVKATVPPPPVFTPQSNTERGVTVEVVPLNLPDGGETLDFEVAFNTHSVDLSFDPAAISVLHDDQGREYPALAWEGTGPGGHHRSGLLRFESPDTPVNFIEVVIHDVAGVPERVFHWNLSQ